MLAKKYRERIRLLVKALRSGKYKQNKGSLASRDLTSFCCLGVACNVYKDNTKKGHWELGTNDTSIFVAGLDTYNQNKEVLPTRVMRWFGFDEKDPIISSDSHTTASELNDEGESFKVIADMFEKKYLKEIK